MSVAIQRTQVNCVAWYWRNNDQPRGQSSIWCSSQVYYRLLRNFLIQCLLVFWKRCSWFQPMVRQGFRHKLGVRQNLQSDWGLLGHSSQYTERINGGGNCTGLFKAFCRRYVEPVIVVPILLSELFAKPRVVGIVRPPANYPFWEAPAPAISVSVIRYPGLRPYWKYCIQESGSTMMSMNTSTKNSNWTCWLRQISTSRHPHHWRMRMVVYKDN